MEIEVLTGPQGGGKSTVMRKEALANQGLYLFALPTIELIEEKTKDFFDARPSLQTVKVYSGTVRGATTKRLTEAREKIESDGTAHAVIFTTHETLMAHGLEGFENWHVRIDEAPAAVQAGSFNIGVGSRSWLTATFDLIQGAEDEWSALRLKVAAPDWKAVERDTGTKGFGEFIKQAGQPDRVFVKCRSWDEKDDIDWFSMWTPLSLAQVASVTFAGSSYTESVGFKAAQALFEDRLGVTVREIAPARTGQPTIAIHYFTRGHEGTTSFWDTSGGRRMLKLVGDCLGSTLPQTAFWSGNEVVQHRLEHLIPGQMIKPMAMGLNKHRAATDCAFIFSGKATPGDKPLQEVFGLSDDDIQRAREGDAIAQFVMRGAIRDPDYGGPYNIYLYSESQAERLRDQLHNMGFTTVALIPVDEAGLMEQRRPKPGRREPTPEDKAAKKAAAREKDSERKRVKRAAVAAQAGRSPGKGGRPQKV